MSEHSLTGDRAFEAEFDPFAGPAFLRAVATTESQRELWTASQLGTDASLAFNESVVLSLTGALEEPALREAIAQLVARHEALRSTFSGDGLTMLVGEVPSAVPVTLHDWTSLTPAEQQARMRSWQRQAVESPFDLEQGPLVRFELARLGGEEHALLVTAHHIVCDGWSFGVIAGDLAALYNEARGVAPGLAPATPYSDYARASAEAIAGPAGQATERFWMEQLSGELPVLELPADYPRPSVKTFRASREDRVLDADLVKRLRQVSAKERASLFAALLAGYGTLMHRLTGQDDIIVGIPAAGQAQGFEGVVGHCVNMVPVRLRPTSSTSFSALLGAARRASLDAFEHQALTLGSLLARLPIVRDPSRPPLISVIFNVDRGLTPEQMPFDGVAAELRSNPRTYETFELFLNAVEERGGVTLECQYNTDLFDGATVQRWLASYELLLRAVVDDVSTEIGALPVVTPEETAALAAWNDAASLDVPAGARVHDLVAAQAARTPNAVAIEFEGRTITYAELEARANQLARRLRALGVRRDVLVGLCVERSVEMFVGLLGILKAGGGYVPLDPGYPAERLAFMVSDSQMPVVVTEERVRREVRVEAPNVLSVDGDAEAIAAESTEPLPPSGEDADAESITYVIYTSGSTGVPKGVLVPHRAVVNLISSVQRTPGISGDDTVLAITTLSFDIAVSEVLAPLTVGARIVLASREVAADGLRLMRLIQSSGVTFIDATPATYRLLFGAGWQGGDLRVICTGEAMPRDLAVTLCDTVREVWNGYGPTETTVWSTFYQVTKPVGKILIGKPVANTQLYFLDARRQPVPLGVKGEMYIGGRGVTHGYLRRPDLTRERFVDDPFAGTPGAKMYKTGDVVRLLPDGNVEYLGRNDNQVKLRGYRIELGEIEDALTHHAGVRSAAVIVREDRPGDKRLVGYVVPADGVEAPNDGALRSHLKQTLPDYMVPSAFVRLTTLPLTPSGKIDRKALPAPQAGESDAAEFVAPRTEAERLVAGLWAEALGVPRISVDDDFFALGGHSLLASQILARLRRDHGVELSFRKIFEAPTVARFAALIESAGTAEPSAAAQAIPRRESRGPAPLSAVQERLWLLEEMDPVQRALHNLSAAWRLRGPVEPALVERALQQFIARHEIMRTSFRVVDGVPAQIAEAEVPFALGHVDWTDKTPAEQVEAIDALCLEEEDTPFDISVAPLLRCSLIKLSADEYVLFTLRHNLVWDGWSFDIFIGEVCEFYRALATNTAPVLPALPITYADFSEWQRGWLAGPELAKQVAWWRERLGGELPVLDMPTDRPRPATPQYGGWRASIAFSLEERERLTTFAREHGSTLFTVLFAGYNLLLHRYSGQTDLLVGTPVRARTRVETEPVVGPFVNTVVLRTQLEPAMTFSDLLGRVRDVTLDAFGHQEMPLEALGGRPPVVRALFSLQDARSRPLSAGPVAVAQQHLPQHTATNDMTLWTMDTPDSLIAVLNYSTDVFDGPTIERFLAQFRALLLDAITDPSRGLEEIDIVPPREREALAASLAPEGAAQPLVAERFAAVAARTPEAVAVRDDSRQTTYAELARDAARVALAIASNGGAGKRVAVCVAPGARRAAALLGVLQGGAVAMLVEPRDPRAYLESVLGDVALVLADGEEIDRVEGLGVPVVNVDTLPAAGEAAGLVAPDADAGALVLHAPGADGAPELATVTHGALAAVLADVAATLDLAAGQRVGAVLPASSDAAAVETLLPLIAGAELVVLADAADDADELGDRLRDEGVSTLVAPWSTWGDLVAAEWTGGEGFTAVVTGSRAANKALHPLAARVGRVFAAESHAETGVWSTMRHVTSPDEIQRVGDALGAARLVVRDERGRVVPSGVPGELWIGGDALTVEARDGAESVTVAGVPLRARRTSERARRMATGGFHVLSTRADVASVEGTRVELVAIERALRAQPSVRDAAVALNETGSGTSRLIAFVVPTEGGAYAESDVRAALGAALPRRMLPRLYVEVPTIPRDASGAPDRDRLQAEAFGRRVASEPPTTQAEILLARLWREALGIGEVGRGDNFFDLGGYSLLCFQVVRKLEEETGVRLSPRVLLMNTLEQAAAQIPLNGTPRESASEAQELDAAQSSGMFGRLKRLVTGR
jgi:amino acid adenylation domain-containing protein